MNIESILRLAPLVKQALFMSGSTLGNPAGFSNYSFGIPEALKDGWDPGIMNDVLKENLPNVAPLYEYESFEKEIPAFAGEAEGSRMWDALEAVGRHSRSAPSNGQSIYDDQFPSDALDILDSVVPEISPEKVNALSERDLEILYQKHALGKRYGSSPATASAIAMLQNNPNIGM